MKFWEYELFMDAINKRLKEEEKQNEEQNKKYGDMNPNSMMKNAQKNMPSIPSPKMPSMPKI